MHHQLLHVWSRAYALVRAWSVWAEFIIYPEPRFDHGKVKVNNVHYYFSRRWTQVVVAFTGMPEMSADGPGAPE
jgi:hypothetical protein